MTGHEEMYGHVAWWVPMWLRFHGVRYCWRCLARLRYWRSR